jgi:hypothetical protein
MQSQRPRPRKEALFVRVPAPDDTVAFHDATAHVGKMMPFAKPQATCGMRATSEVVSFSLLHLTKRTAANIAAKELEMPRGPLASLERRAQGLSAEEFGADDLLVEMKDETYKFKISRDSNKVLSLETAEDAEDSSFELPKAAVQMRMYLRSPGVGRVLAVGFIGHVGKPESSETVRRVAAMVLNSVSQLTPFKVLADIETVQIPASPARFAVRPSRKPSEEAAALIPVWLFSDGDQPAHVATGSVKVKVDLESANPTSSRLLFHFEPSEEVAAHWEAYHQVADRTIAGAVRDHLGDDDITTITYDIVLGEVDDKAVSRLRDALETLGGGLDFTPRMYQPHGAA